MHVASVRPRHEVLRPTRIFTRAVSERVHPTEPILLHFTQRKLRGVPLMLRVDNTLNSLTKIDAEALEKWMQSIGSWSSTSTSSASCVHPHRLRLLQPFHDLLLELEDHWRDDHHSSPHAPSVIRNLVRLGVPLRPEWGVLLARAISSSLARCVGGGLARRAYIEEIFDVCSLIWGHENPLLRRGFIAELCAPLNLMLMQSLNRKSIENGLLQFVLTALSRPYADAPSGYQDSIKYFSDPRFVQMLQESVHEMNLTLVLQLMTMYANKVEAGPLVSDLVDRIEVEDIYKMEPKVLATYAECLEYLGKGTKLEEMKAEVVNRINAFMEVDTMEAKEAVCDILLVHNDPRLETVLTPKLPNAYVARGLVALSSFPDWVEEWGGNLATLEDISGDLVGRLANHWIHNAKKIETFEALAEYTSRHFHPESALALAEAGKLDVDEWMLSRDVELELLLLNDDVRLAPVVQALCLSGYDDPQIWKMVSRCLPAYTNSDLSSSLYLASLAGYIQWPHKERIRNFWNFEQEKYLSELETGLRNTGFKFASVELPNLPKELWPSFVVEDSIYVWCSDESTFKHPVTGKDRGSVLLRSAIWREHGLKVHDICGPMLRREVENKNWNYLSWIQQYVATSWASRNPVAALQRPKPVEAVETTSMTLSHPVKTAPSTLPQNTLESAQQTQTEHLDIQKLLRVFPKVARGFSFLPGIEVAVPALSRANPSLQQKILRRVQNIPPGDQSRADAALRMLREHNEALMAELEVKYKNDNRAIAAIKELKTWDVELVTWTANRFKQTPQEVEEHAAKFIWSVLTKESMSYPKTMVRKLFPSCQSLVHQIERYEHRVQYRTWKKFLAEYRKPDVHSHRSLLQKILDQTSLQWQKGPLKDVASTAKDANSNMDVPKVSAPGSEALAVNEGELPTGQVHASNSKVLGADSKTHSNWYTADTTDTASPADVANAVVAPDVVDVADAACEPETPSASSVDEDLLTLAGQRLSKETLAELMKHTANTRRRIAWQYLDTISSTDDPDEFMRKVIEETLKYDQYLVEKRMMRDALNPSGKIHVPLERLKAVLDEILPKNHARQRDVFNRMRRIPQHIQKKVLDRYMSTKDQAKVSNKTAWFLGILSIEIRQASQATVSEDTPAEDIALLRDKGLSDASLEAVARKPSDTRRRIIWQYLDTVGESEEPNKKLAAVIKQTLRHDRYLVTAGIRGGLNPSGRILVPFEKLNPILEELFADELEKKRHYIFDRMRRLPERSQARILSRYMGTKDEERVKSKPAWFLGILIAEFKNAHKIFIA